MDYPELEEETELQFNTLEEVNKYLKNNPSATECFKCTYQGKVFLDINKPFEYKEPDPRYMHKGIVHAPLVAEPNPKFQRKFRTKNRTH